MPVGTTSTWGQQRAEKLNAPTPPTRFDRVGAPVEVERERDHKRDEQAEADDTQHRAHEEVAARRVDGRCKHHAAHDADAEAADMREVVNAWQQPQRKAN